MSRSACTFLILAFLACGVTARAQYVLGEAAISVYSDHVVGYSMFETDYNTAAYYIVEADGYIVQDGSTILDSGSQMGYDPAQVNLYSSDSIGHAYYVQTNMWLWAAYEVWDGSEYDYSDPYGYSLLGGGNYSGNSGDIYAPDEPVYTIPEPYFIGSVYVGDTTYPPQINPGGLNVLGSPVRGGSGYVEIYGSDLAKYADGPPYWTSVAIDGGVSTSITYGDYYSSPGQVNISYTIPENTATGSHNLTVTTAFGSSSASFQVDDPTPLITDVEPQSWSGTTNFTVTGQGFGSNPSISISGQGILSYSGSGSDTTFAGTVNVDPNAAGTATVTITSGGFGGNGFLPGPGGGSTSGSNAYQVRLQPITLTQSPSTINLSTGDTAQSGTPKYISVSVNPSTVTFNSTFQQSLIQDPHSSCDASLSFSGSGTGTVNSLVTASPSDCGGQFTVQAYYSSLTGPVYSNSSTTVTVPPQAILLQMFGETNGAYPNNQTPELSVASAGQNRFAYSGTTYLFGGVSTWQDLIASGKVANRGTPTNGREPELDNAVAIFTGSSGDIVGGATCYWSPRNEELPYIQAALNSGTSTFPYSIPMAQGSSYSLGSPLPGILDPQCWSADGSQTQIVWKTSMPNNLVPDFQSAPAFLFERQRTPGAPAVVQIP